MYTVNSASASGSSTGAGMSPAAPGPTTASGAPVEHVDLATVIEVSQALSGETVLEKLIDVLMRTAVEHAGAKRGLLILSRGAEQRIVAEVSTGGEAMVVGMRDDAVDPAALPVSVLNHVLRTREIVVLDDASAENSFSADAYLGQRQARSVLCLPVSNRGKLLGVVYLENNLAPRVFTPAGIAVLKLLASQAAVSLENVRLYRELAEREARIRRLVEANIVGILIWDLDGNILDANEAFLRMVGHDRQDLAAGGLRWTDLTPAEWHDRDRQQVVAQVKCSGSVQPFEWELFHRDGSRVPMLTGAALFEGENQGVSFVLDLSQLKAAERALHESEELWRATFEASPTMYFMVDRAGLLSLVNAFAADKLGYPASELIGRSWLDLCYEPERDAMRQHAEVCFREVGRMAQWEARKLRKDGSVMWVLETANAVLVRDRPMLLISCEDITERKRVEQALRHSEAYLAEAQRLVHMGSWAYDHVPGKIKHYSDETFRLFGLDPRRPGGPPQLEEIRQLIHPEDRERVFAELAQVFRNKAQYDQQYRIVLPEGTVRHLHSRGQPVVDATGELLEYFGTVVDVTERTHTEQRLFAHQQVTHILAEAATVEEATPKILQAVCEHGGWDLGVLWRIDRDAGLLRCAEFWCRPSVQAAQFEAVTRTTTFPPGRGLPGRVWSSGAPTLIPDVVKDPNFPRAPAAAREGLHTACAFPILLGREVLGVLEFLTREAQRPQQAMFDLILGSQIGQFIERKRAESALQLSQARLAHVTRVMTVGELTASIAHEVNQPLGAIVTSAASCSRWLTAEPPNMEKALRALERIANDGKRASEVIRRIRTLMKRQAPHKEWLDINDTILEVIAIAQHQLRRAEIRLETRLADTLPLVQGDRVQLQQVLLNLMVNAIEAMSGVERRRELTIVSTAEGPDAVRIEVLDSGIGLGPELASHLFEPFYTTKAEGVGIGLSISRSIVEAHGGHLSAAANAPHGAVFGFSLPVAAPVA